MNLTKNSSGWNGFRGAMILLALLGALSRAFGQAYPDNQTPIGDISNSNQDSTQETRRSDHFRVVFGHYSTDTGNGGMSEAMAQGNLQQFEGLWHRWVVEDGLSNINTSPLVPGNYRANFWFLETENDGGGGGSFNSADGNGFFWAMGNPGLEAFDPYSGVNPHEWGDCWWGTEGGYLNTTVGGNLDECMGNWGMLQWLNWYPDAGNYIANGMYTPIHGRDYFDSWPIFELAIQTPGYGYPYMNALFSRTNATVAQQETEYWINRMIRLDPSGSADSRGVVNDLWGNMAKRLVTWDFQRQQWLVNGNTDYGQGSSDPGTAWAFYQRCRTPLIPIPGTNGWYRGAYEHAPQEFGWNIIPLAATPGTTVSCNFQPVGDPVRNSDWRACLVAVSTNAANFGQGNTNAYASYSTLWNCGINSITLSPDQNQLYLVVIATPRPVGTEVMSDWWAYLEEAGLQFPYTVAFNNAAPLNVAESLPTGVTWTSHTNPDGTICRNIASTATVASTAYVSSNAMVIGSAHVLNSAQVLDYGVVRDSAVVSGNAVVSGHGEVRDSAQVSGFGKVRDWGRVIGYSQVSGYGKVIEHATFGGSDSSGSYDTASGSAVIKGTTVVYAPSTFNGCLIMDGDSSDGNGTTPASYGVHFGWQWGDNSTAFWSGLTNNNYQYCGLTFENTSFLENGIHYGISNNPVFAADQYGINHGFLMNGCAAAVDTGTNSRGGYVLPLNGTNQYVELHNSVNDFNDTTLAVWFKNTGGASDQRIWSMGNGSNKVMYLTPNDGATGNLRFIITDGKTTNYLNGAAAPANTWTHVAVVFAQAASNCVLYVNGHPVTTNTAITLFPDSLNAPLMANANYLGRGNVGNYFQGSVDDFRVFMRSLAASDVLALYNTPAPAAVTPVTDTPPGTPGWLVAPYAVSDSAITMSATWAASALGWSQYYFSNNTVAGHDSGWVTFNKYTDCGLTPGASYSYTVLMRDASGHVTSASAAAGAATLVSAAGTASFACGPVGYTSGQITMTANTVTNVSGKTEYDFNCTSGGGHSSGWQASPSWTDTGLASGGSYGYTVTVRDGRGNTSAPSAAGQARAGDYMAPPFPLFQQAEWFVLPYPTVSNSVSMTAATATDPGGVQYYFHCSSGNAPDSGWQSSPTYNTPILTNGSYSYQYMLRDLSANTNQSADSTTYSAKVTPTTGYEPCAFSQLTSLPDDDLVTFSGTVIGVSSNSYLVCGTNNSSTITVWPATYGEVTSPTLNFQNVNVSGHLYTFTNGPGRVVTYATLTSSGVPAYSISGTVTDANGVPLAGVTIYLSTTPGASANPAETVITGANGQYTIGVLNGAWHLCAGSAIYATTADQVVAVNSASVANVNFGGLTPNPVISGQVTDASGNPISGASVYFSLTPNASVAPLYAATTTAAGTYVQAVPLNADLYVCAAAGGYLTSPDQWVAATNSVGNLSFALAQNPLENATNWGALQTNQLFFSTLTDLLPQSGSITNWPTFMPAGASLAGQGSPAPSVQLLGRQKWVQLTNNNAALMGFLQGTYSTPIPCSGASIVLAVIPRRNGVAEAWTPCVSVLYNRLELGVDPTTGKVSIQVNGNQAHTLGTIPNGEPTILSLVVQSNGHYLVWTNGVPFYTNNITSTLTSLIPGVAGSYADTINVGNDGPDGWSTFSGDIGDVFVYTNALSNTSRQLLESYLLAGFGANGTTTIAATAGLGGSVTPGGLVSVISGNNQTFAVTPAPGANGWAVSNVVVDGVSQGAISSYTFTNVTASHTISASFANANTIYTIAASGGFGGTISPAGTQAVVANASQVFTFTPNSGYAVGGVVVDGTNLGAISSYTFTNITTNHSIAISFSPIILNIAASAVGTEGTIYPSGNLPVPVNGSQSFNIVANTGYGSDVIVDGVDQGSASGYTFTNVTSSHVITVKFCAAVSVNYYLAGATTPALLSTDNAGFVAVTHWNNITNAGNGGFINPVETFYDSTGASVSGFDARLPNSNSYSWNTVGTPSMNLFGDWALTGGGNLTLTKVPYATYNLYVYFAGWGGPNIVTYTIGSNTQTLTNTLSPSGEFVPGNNMVVFTGLTNPTPVVRVALVSGGNLGVSAFQIVGVPTYYTLTASAGAGGTISPAGITSVNPGANLSFAMAPNSGYAVSNVTVDAVSQGAITSYTFTNVAASHTINATFALPPPPPALSSFTLADGVPTFSFGTVAGYKYSLVYKNALTDPNWLPVIAPPAFPAPGGWSAPSTGLPMSLGDTNAFGQSQRFYQIEAAIP